MLAKVFGDESDWPEQDLIGFSAEFDAQLAVAAYCSGVFPMPLHETGFDGQMGWWSPVYRGVLPLDGLRATRSLRKSAKRYTTTVDAAFDLVLERCADPAREHGWIDGDIRRVYRQLHREGVAHSVETWDERGRLVGGLYGIAVGGLFAGESMFHDQVLGRDASKVALMRLVEVLDDGNPDRLLDVQWQTPHLASLGVVEVERPTYLFLLERALDQPGVDWPGPDSAPTTSVADHIGTVAGPTGTVAGPTGTVAGPTGTAAGPTGTAAESIGTAAEPVEAPSPSREEHDHA